MSKLIAVTLFVVLLFQGAWVESAKISKVETEGQTPLLFPPDYTSKGSAFAECLTGNSTTDMAIWRGGSALRGRTSNFQFLNDSPTDVWYSCSADGVNLIEVGWYAQCPPIWVYITSQGTTWKQNTTCCIPPTVFSPPFQVCGQTYSSCKELFLDPYSANNFPAGGLFAMPATDCVDSTGGGRGIRCQPLKNGTWLSDSRYNFQYSVINQTDTLQTIPGTNYVWPTSIQATGSSSNFEFIAGNFSYFDGQLGDPTTAIDDSLQAYCDMSAANVSQISVVLPNQVLVLESENYPNKLTFYDFATQQLSPSMAFPIDQVNDNYGWLNGIAPYVSPITGTNDPCKALAFGFNYTTRTLTALLLDLPGQNLTQYPVSGFPKHVDPNFDTPVCSDSLPVCILPLYVDEATFLYNLTWSPGSSSMQLSLLKVVPFESDMMFVTDTDIWLVYEQYYSFQIVRLELATGHLLGEWAYTNLDETTFLSIKQFDPKSLTFYGIQSSYFANLFAFQYSLTNGMFTGGLALYENNVDIEMIPIDQSVIFFTCPPFYLSNGDLTVSFIGPNTSQGNMVITRNQNTNLRIFQFPENNSVEKFDYITPQFFSSCPALQP